MKKLSTILLIPVFFFLLKNNIIELSMTNSRENNTIEVTKNQIIIKENNSLRNDNISNTNIQTYQINNYNICIYNIEGNANLSQCDFIYLLKYDDLYDLKLSSKTHAIIYQNSLKLSNKLLEDIYLNWIDTYPNDNIYLLLEESYQIKNIPKKL